MTFFATEIDSCPGFGFQGGPEFSTNVQAMASGREKRNAEWSTARHKYTVPFIALDSEKFQQVKRVFMMCKGRAHTFLHRDWADYNATNEFIANGDGALKVFQLIKTYGQDSGDYVRTIDKPDTSTGAVQIRVNGILQTSGVVVDSTTGVVTFAVAPSSGAVITWTGLFYVHVRFDMDYLPFSIDNKSKGDFVQNGSVDLIEVPGEDG
jgi:uncharacterized protein (TIGR02217 family)